MPVGRDIAYGRWLLAITLCGALLRFWGVSGQPLLDDEVGAAFAAVNYLENGQFGPIMWYHPHLRSLVLYPLGQMFGYSPLLLRLPSLLAGTLAIPLTGDILRRLGGGRLGALLAASLLALEEVHIVFSRQAIQETWTTVLFLAGVWLVLYYHQEGRRPLPLLLAGLAFGAGLASKSHAAFPLLFCLASLLFASYREKNLPRFLFEAAALVLVPFSVYFLSWLPWFARGYGLPDWVAMQQALLHKMTSHTGNPMDQPIDRAAREWFLRPMLVYGNFTMDGTVPWITLSWSNPLVWLGVLPATIQQIRRAVRESEPLFALAGRPAAVGVFLISYLPLALSSRPIWLLSSLAVLPFAFMLLARSLTEICGAFRWGSKILAGYLLLVTVVSLLAWPMATGRGMHSPYLAPFVAKYRSVMEGGLGSQP